jgi:hypothetical protein
VFTVTVKRLAMERLIVVSTRPLSGALGDRWETIDFESAKRPDLDALM